MPDLASPSQFPVVSFDPHPRRPSHTSTPQRVSPSPSYSFSQTSTASTSTPNSSGLSSFRSLRNLLPFGSGPKQPATPGDSTSGGSRNPFSGFGSVRKSSSGDRKTSSSHPREVSNPDTPVLSIGASSSNQSAGQDNTRKHKLSGLVPPARDVKPAFAAEPPGQTSESPSLGHDLSTIIESDISGISKHIPPLDDGRQDDRDLSRDDASFDLSQFKAEVMHALKSSSPRDEWSRNFTGDERDAAGSYLDPESDAGGAPENTSFNLSALDPDLAALLSPHRYANRDPAIARAVDALPPPTLTPSPSFGAIPHIRLAPSPVLDEPVASSPSKQASDRPHSSPASRRASLSVQSPTPASATRFSRTATSRASPRPSPLGGHTPPPTSFALPPPSPHENGDRRPSFDSAYRVGTANESRSRKNSTGETPYGRPRGASQSRFATPVRPSASPVPSHSQSHSGRPTLHRLLTAPFSSSQWESESTPPTRPSSAVGSASAAAARRMQSSRASMDSPSSFDRDRTATHVRTRKRRSASVSLARAATPVSVERSPSTSAVRPVLDVLGPRTQRVFAAAGLLGNRSGDRGDRSGGSPSLPRSKRSASESEFGSRSQGASSRAGGYSDPTSTSVATWARSGSVTRTLTPDLSTPHAPAHSYPRRASVDSPSNHSTTPRSPGTSTGYTSISAGSEAVAAAEVQALKDRHTMETGALLAALADSQRSSAMMKDENTRLKDRVGHLETRLREVMEELQRQNCRSLLPSRRPSPSPSQFSQFSTPPQRLHERSGRSERTTRSHSRTQGRPSSASAHRSGRSQRPSLDLPLARGWTERPPSDTHSTTTRSRVTSLDDRSHRPSLDSTVYSERSGQPSEDILRDLEMDETVRKPLNGNSGTQQQLQARVQLSNPHTRRNSATSALSVFPVLPSNMTMLMHEEGVERNRSTAFSFSSQSHSPPSPTRALSKVARSRNGRTHTHARHPSVASSASGVSPTGASFAVLGGSPGSLHLRPEHELYLGEMSVLSLDMGSDSEDLVGDDDGEDVLARVRDL